MEASAKYWIYDFYWSSVQLKNLWQIDHNKQFLHLPQWFQNLSAAEALESVCMLERVKYGNLFHFR